MILPWYVPNTADLNLLGRGRDPPRDGALLDMCRVRWPFPLLQLGMILRLGAVTQGMLGLLGIGGTMTGS